MRKKVLVILFVEVALIMSLTISIYAVTGISKGTVRIRESASTDSEVISVTADKEKVEILGEENGWYKVKFEDVTGFMSKDYVDLEENSNVETNTQPENQENETPKETETTSEPETTNKPETTAEPQNTNTSNEITTYGNNIEGTKIKLVKEVSLRSLPSFSSIVTTDVEANIEVSVEKQLNNWIKISDGNVTGWMVNCISDNESKPSEPETPVEPETPTQTETPVEPTPSEPETPTPPETTTPDTSTQPPSITPSDSKTGKINVDSARIRKSPDGEIIDVADLNDKVEILSEEGDWYKVKVEGHEDGYIAKRLVTLDN